MSAVSVTQTRDRLLHIARMTVVAHCPARAALAGNPSDGYGGFVVSVPVTSVTASVSVEPAERFEIVHSPTADDTFDDLTALVDHIDRFGTDDTRRLVLATLRAMVRRTGMSIDPMRISVSTTIPRSVGLAGSSAIIIATIRALVATNPTSEWATSVNSPDALAELALSVERDELGIAAGLQDRLVQSYGVPVAMDFSTSRPQCTPLGKIPGDLLVAWNPSGAEPSGHVHASLRSNYDDDVGTTHRTMAEIAEQGRLAGDAIRSGDVDALGAAIDHTLTLRSRLLSLDPRMLAASATVRDLGGHANWTGSGGAIVILLPDPGRAALVKEPLAADYGCRFIDV
jgi:glucuronokinase